jgi:membrane protease subunit HflK
MDRNIKKNGLVNFIALVIGATITYGVSRQANYESDDAAIVLMATGVLVAAYSYFQMRLLERERLEKLELDELAKSKGSTAMFTQDVESFPARHAREQFEKWVVPAFTILLLVAQAGLAYWLWKGLGKTPGPQMAAPTIVMTFYGLAALVMFFLGKYSAGLAKLEGQQLLRPSASYLSLGAYLIGLATISIAASMSNYPRVDYYLARALCVILTLVAVENLLNLILEIYRPRRRGEQARVLYDSRLIGALSQPEEFFSTAAQALDYQFGFKVSETDFYRGMQRRLPLIILLQVGVLLLSTCVVFIEPSEEGLLERFGRPVEGRAVLEPGFHPKLPWPIDAVHRYRTKEIQNFQVGFVPDPDKDKEKTILWTVAHYKEEFNLLVATGESETKTGQDQKSVPASLLTVSIPIQFRINDVKKWALVNTDADKLLEKLATREVVRYLVGVDLNEIMSSGRQAAAAALQKRIQARAQEFNLGVDILFVGLQDIHPPTSVAEAYQAVVGALQEKEAKIHAAEGYALYTNALGQARAHRIVDEAKAYHAGRVAGASAQAARFTNQLAAFNGSSVVYPARAYYHSLTMALSGTNGPRKYIVIPTNTVEVYQLNLEDKVRMDLLDVPIAPVKK